MRLEGVWRVSGGCLEDVWKGLKGGWRLTQIFLDDHYFFHTKFFRHRIRPTNNFLNQEILFLTYVL